MFASSDICVPVLNMLRPLFDSRFAVACLLRFRRRVVVVVILKMVNVICVCSVLYRSHAETALYTYMVWTFIPLKSYSNCMICVCGQSNAEISVQCACTGNNPRDISFLA